MHEPQVNAWYAVRGDAVTVLDGSVTGLAAGTKLALADYRAELHQRYADKLSGSAYDRDGAGGGYGGRERAVPAAAPAGCPCCRSCRRGPGAGGGRGRGAAAAAAVRTGGPRYARQPLGTR